MSWKELAGKGTWLGMAAAAAVLLVLLGVASLLLLRGVIPESAIHGAGETQEKDRAEGEAPCGRQTAETGGDIKQSIVKITKLHFSPENNLTLGRTVSVRCAPALFSICGACRGRYFPHIAVSSMCRCRQYQSVYKVYIIVFT